VVKGRSIAAVTGTASRTVALIASAVSLACGPAKPVLVYVPASVTIDPNGSPRRSSVVASPSRNFWEAMSSLDTGYVRRHPSTEEQRAFASALGMIMSGRHDDAALALDGIRSSTSDTTVAAAARVLVTAMLQYQDKWKLLAELDSMGRQASSRSGIPDKAGVESWSSAFRRVDAREMSFPSKPVTLPLLVSASGTPMITLRINGKEHVFWLDTGSSMSIVSASVAAECDIKPLVSDTLEVATTTGRVPAQAGAISRLDIGGIRILNSTALIVSDDRLQVRVSDDAGLPITVQIDGVIGYDIISRIDMRLDYINHRATLARPAINPAPPRTGRNLFWVGTPIVRLVTSKGIPLHFNLDTGAQETYSTDGLPAKTKTRTFSGERRLIGGLGGVTIVHGRFVDELRATMAGQPLLLRKLLVFAPAFSSFVSLDGILGSDVGRGGIVRIDATNGIFRLEPESRGLRPTS